MERREERQVDVSDRAKHRGSGFTGDVLTGEGFSESAMTVDCFNANYDGVGSGSFCSRVPHALSKRDSQRIDGDAMNDKWIHALAVLALSEPLLVKSIRERSSAIVGGWSRHPVAKRGRSRTEPAPGQAFPTPG